MRSPRTIAVLIMTALAVMTVPAAALAAPNTVLLTNDYGYSFAAQSTCLTTGCHSANYAKTAHSVFLTTTIQPADAAYWPVTAPNGRGLTFAKSDIAFMFGAYSFGTAVDYLVFEPVAGSPQTNPFKRVDGLVFDPASGWVISSSGTGLAKNSSYCGARCHTLGAQKPGTGKTIPNPHATAQPSATTADAWARVPGSDLMQLQTFVPGSSIQCENCHGTGVPAAADLTGHNETAPVEVVGFQSSHAASRKILDSDICGQCHINSTDVPGTLGTVGYTADRPLRDFVVPATTIPSREAFESSAAVRSAAKFYPNGSNKSMGHNAYNEWLVSGHSVRVQLATSSPDASAYQKSGASHFRLSRASTGCLKCHTGEGYLARKLGTLTGMMKGFDTTTLTVGFYGQECAICHYSHDPDGSGLGVRSPDTSGTGSCAGLSTSNGSICEDCHNWQVEIMGAAIAPGEAVRHPQRETRAARGLSAIVDLPNGREYMPSVECEECHMPKTREELFSHRMKLMLPGDAAAWGVPAGGDSCSECQEGDTLAVLQSQIDDVQEAIDSKMVQAELTLASAKARAASRTTDVDDRAASAVSWVENDASRGFHNPAYISAALDRAILYSRAVGARFTQFTVSGSPAFCGGKLVDGAGAALSGQTVKVYSGSTLLGTAVTDASGKWAALLPSASTYTAKWVVGSRVLATMNKTVTSVRASTGTVYYGRTFTLSGAVSPRSTGSVAIYAKKGTGSFARLYTLPLSSTGTYAKAVRPSARAVWQYYVYYGGSTTSAPSKSATVKIVVR